MSSFKFQVKKLSEIYLDVDDVDLFVGGFLEAPDGDSILGPTFRCIIGDTFARLVPKDEMCEEISRFFSLNFFSLKVGHICPVYTRDN